MSVIRFSDCTPLLVAESANDTSTAIRPSMLMRIASSEEARARPPRQ